MYWFVFVLLIQLPACLHSLDNECCRPGFDEFDCVLGSLCNNITKKCACRALKRCEKCLHGYIVGDDGCQQCKCATKETALPMPTECPEVKCGLVCKKGYRKNSKGCEVCRCNWKAPECVYDQQNRATNFPCTNIYDASKCRPGFDQFDCKEGSSCNFNTKKCSCPEVNCRAYCHHGYQYEPNGCAKCKCALKPTTNVIKGCAGVRCDLKCPLGFQKNDMGCDVCRCKEAVEPSGCRPRYDWYDCQWGKTCNNQTRTCSCKKIDCRMYCENGYVFGDDGCATCDCEFKEGFNQITEDCPALRCGVSCPHGFDRHYMGCRICKCLPKPSKKMSLLSKCLYNNENQVTNSPCFDIKTSVFCRPRYHEFDCLEGSTCNSKSKKCQCKAIECDVCLFGYLPDDYGCPTCVCASKASKLGEVSAGCPGVKCGLQCPKGYKTNGKGCPICRCAEATTYY